MEDVNERLTGVTASPQTRHTDADDSKAAISDDTIPIEPECGAAVPDATIGIDDKSVPQQDEGVTCLPQQQQQLQASTGSERMMPPSPPRPIDSADNDSPIVATKAGPEAIFVGDFDEELLQQPPSGDESIGQEEVSVPDQDVGSVSSMGQEQENTSKRDVCDELEAGNQESEAADQSRTPQQGNGDTTSGDEDPQQEQEHSRHDLSSDAVHTPADGNDSDSIQPQQIVRSSLRQRIIRVAGRMSAEKFTKELKLELRTASESLLDLLFQHLSSGESNIGLSLPASALGWLSLQLYSEEDSVLETDTPSFPASALLRDRLSLLRYVLPRATHVRITTTEWPLVSGNRKRRQRRRNWNHVRRTMAREGDTQDAAAAEVTLPPFLAYYDSLRSHPRIDMKLFPNCQVLFLDEVPIEAVRNLSTVRASLRLVRVEGGNAISNLGGFFAFDSPPEVTLLDTQGDPLTQGVSECTDYPHLTHIKLSYCGLGDSAGSSALSKLSDLQSLCLSHNNITSEEAFTGLAFLNKLDLSYNKIDCLRTVHYQLGNIQTLNLSHNKLETTVGIDRLLALKTLWIDHNAIEDLSQIRGLARLPELENLYVRGNPIELRTPRKFRVELLDLFREKRFSSLPSRNATYRDLLNILPILDDNKASIVELKALVNRSYAAPMVIDISTETGISERRSSAIEPVRGSKRTLKSRRALVDQPTEHVVLEKSSNAHPGISPVADFSLGQVLESLCSEPLEGPPELEEKRDEILPENEADNNSSMGVQAEDDCADNLSVGEDADSESESKMDTFGPECNENKLVTDEASNDPAPRDFETPAEEQTSEIPVEECNPIQDFAKDEIVFRTDTGVVVSQSPKETMEASLEVAETCDEKVRASKNVFINEVSETDVQDDSRESYIATGSDVDVVTDSPLSVTKPGDSEELKTSASTAATDIHGSSEKDMPLSETTNEVASTTPNVSSRSLSNESCPESPTRLSISFPDVVSNDDHNSVHSSVGTAHRSDARKFQLAEENCSYDGPGSCRNFLVHSDLDLYFRLFVFTQIKEDDMTSSSTNDAIDDTSDWHGVLKRYPRIQLCQTDRLLRETSDEDSGQPEQFRRVWKERVVGCGESALRRLTPIAASRYGFHGELLWSDSATAMKPEMVVVSRELIACLSSTCFYFIVDHDKVTGRTEAPRGKFPRPIPKTSLFEEATWPHALARHPISTLRAITIGFGFQRLTLRFGDTETKSPSDFTYILLTSNKVQTVSILKELQNLVQENHLPTDMYTDEPDDTLAIENDDRHVLDALGVTVAPDVLGVVLHYQILGQKWRRGDRGVVRRVCVVTDTKLFLLDEDYGGDGSKSYVAGGRNDLGETRYQVVDSAGLEQVMDIQGGDADPNSITLVIRPLSSFQKTRNWRLVCRDHDGADRLIEDVRRAMTLVM